MALLSALDKLIALTQDECKHWSQMILSNQSLWRRRIRGIDYYSLGLSYDAIPRYGGFNQDWKNAVLQNNKVMCHKFASLYKKVSKQFENFFGKPISLTNRLAVPGFNIFGPKPGIKPAFFNSVFYEYGGNIHNHSTPDWMHKALDRPKIEVPLFIYSFTIPMRLPGFGSGLNFWESKDISGPPSFLRYSEGKAYGFAGNVMHQVPPICSCQKMAPDDYRITMQNHFLELEERVIMFF